MNKVLRKQLVPHGYYKCKQMPGLWKHATRPISFTLVVDAFGVKYVNKDDVNHLIQCLKKKYELTKDCDGNLYCGIKLNWNYDDHTMDMMMPGYIIKQLHSSMQTQPNHNIARILYSHHNMVAKHNGHCP